MQVNIFSRVTELPSTCYATVKWSLSEEFFVTYSSLDSNIAMKKKKFMGISESRTVRTNYNTNFQSIIVKVPNLKQVEIKDKLNSWAKPYKKYIIEPRIN